MIDKNVLKVIEDIKYVLPTNSKDYKALSDIINYLSDESIYMITVMTELSQDDLGWPIFGSSRTVGWLKTFDEAQYLVINNIGDIWETCYTYAVIERIEEGIYPYGKPRFFYKFDIENKQYVEIKEPEWLKSFVNIGIG